MDTWGPPTKGFTVSARNMWCRQRQILKTPEKSVAVQLLLQRRNFFKYFLRQAWSEKIDTTWEWHEKCSWLSANNTIYITANNVKLWDSNKSKMHLTNNWTNKKYIHTKYNVTGWKFLHPKRSSIFKKSYVPARDQPDHDIETRKPKTQMKNRKRPIFVLSTLRHVDR